MAVRPHRPLFFVEFSLPLVFRGRLFPYYALFSSSCRPPRDLALWEAKTWEFTAVDTITVLEFHTAMAPLANSFGGPLLDDVRVVAAD